MFQVADAARRTKRVDRADHVWHRIGKKWKCVLCGAVVIGGLPPDYPTPKEWRPLRYEKLTDEERAMCPEIPNSFKEIK